VDPAVAEAGAGRVGERLSALAESHDLRDSDSEALLGHVAQQLDRRGIAYLELHHGDPALDAERRISAAARQHFGGPLLRNGGFTDATGRRRWTTAAPMPSSSASPTSPTPTWRRRGAWAPR
jgi:N-ethylmaleimide reductase